jgi:hypothetical protein
MKLNVRHFRNFLVSSICLSFAIFPATSEGAELSKETLQAWDAYVQTANSQMINRTHGSFLWLDEVPNRSHSVHDGMILVSPIGQQNPKPVPSGLIHDWIGAVYIPNAKLRDVLFTARDYSHYKEFYKPDVIDSKSLGTVGACDKYSMLLANHQIVASATFEGEYEACYHRLDDRRWYSIARTTRLREIRRYAEPGEQALPPDQGGGYIWRVYSCARYEERDGGVYIELEAIVLSRDIPTAMRWVVAPIVRRVSKNAMLASLRQMEEAVDLNIRNRAPNREAVTSNASTGLGSHVGNVQKLNAASVASRQPRLASEYAKPRRKSD